MNNRHFPVGGSKIKRHGGCGRFPGAAGARASGPAAAARRSAAPEAARSGGAGRAEQAGTAGAGRCVRGRTVWPQALRGLRGLRAAACGPGLPFTPAQPSAPQACPVPEAVRWSPPGGDPSAQPGASREGTSTRAEPRAAECHPLASRGAVNVQGLCLRTAVTGELTLKDSLGLGITEV